MPDTGIRYPNKRDAEVHVTGPDEPVENLSASTRDFGWRCAGCRDHNASYEKLTIREARTAAIEHARQCTALPPVMPNPATDPNVPASVGGAVASSQTTGIGA